MLISTLLALTFLRGVLCVDDGGDCGDCTLTTVRRVCTFFLTDDPDCSEWLSTGGGGALSSRLPRVV